MAGRAINVSMVEVIRPPMTTVASGRCTSAPSPVDSAIGTKPMDATMAVMATGRSRCDVPSRTMRITLVRPCVFSPLNADNNTMPLSTATPNRAMKPTPAEMEKGMPRMRRAAMPPIEARGMALKIIRDSVTLLNVANSSSRISRRAAGTATVSRAVALARFSKAPPKCNS